MGMFAFVLAAFLIVLTLVTVARNPWILVLAALVFFYFYAVIPSKDPTAARFGELDPQASPTPVPVRRAIPVTHRRATTALPSDQQTYPAR